MTTIAKERIKGCIHAQYYVEMAFSAKDFFGKFQIQKDEHARFRWKINTFGCNALRNKKRIRIFMPKA